jgi:hypothetical protein
MPNEPKRTSERARKRTAGKTLREALILRREACFDLLVSRYSIEQDASDTKRVRPRFVVLLVTHWRSGNSMRRRITLRFRVARAIAPFLKVVRELNFYHGDNVGLARRDARVPLRPA